MKSQTKNLNAEVLKLDDQLNTFSMGVISKGNDLIAARKVESNIATTIEQLSNCLPVLECYSKLLRQVDV